MLERRALYLTAFVRAVTTSLVGVLREAHDTGQIVPVGDDEPLNEERYWQVHPPERDE